MNIGARPNAPVQPQVETSCADVVHYSICLPCPACGIRAPQPGRVRKMDSWTKPALFGHRNINGKYLPVNCVFVNASLTVFSGNKECPAPFTLTRFMYNSS